MTKVVHCRKAPHDIYIGRPSKWGNPFSHRPGTIARFRVKTREEAVSAYKRWLLDNPGLLAEVESLRGKVLGCWCKPLACHGDILAELADGDEMPEVKA